MRQAARMYMETQVTTTSQGQVLIMLYDGAIKFLNQAKERIQAKDYAGKGKLISSAIDVINELASSLNPEKGGDLAANLSQLYFYCNKRLFMANSRMDTAPVDEVIKILGGIRSAYAQIIDTPEAVAAMEQAAAHAAASQKAPRAPVGIQSAAPGTPVPAARARNAYAAQSAASAEPDLRETPADQAPEAAVAEPSGQPVPASGTVAEEPAVPVAEAAPEQPDLPDIPDMAPPPITQGKRLAASNLYRKFAS